MSAKGDRRLRAQASWLQVEKPGEEALKRDPDWNEHKCDYSFETNRLINKQMAKSRIFQFVIRFKDSPFLIMNSFATTVKILLTMLYSQSAKEAFRRCEIGWTIRRHQGRVMLHCVNATGAAHC
jgi:hypothetical protein